MNDIKEIKQIIETLKMHSGLYFLIALPFTGAVILLVVFNISNPWIAMLTLFCAGVLIMMFGRSAFASGKYVALEAVLKEFKND